MELMDLYNQIHNPIDDPKVIEKLIGAYARLSRGFGGYYDKLTKVIKGEQTESQYYISDADKFYAMLFNKWKNSILAMTRAEFVELYKQGSYGKDFIKMREYLKTISDVSTKEEADRIYNYKGDKELESALKKYSWMAFGRGSGWIHVCSRYLTAKKDQYQDEKHRLYLNLKPLDVYKMATYLVEKYDEHHLPYYFKFDEFANRDDTIIIYSSTENLIKYIEILQEIKREHPELVSRVEEPPVVAGKIDGWIGYGSESSEKFNGKTYSFNEIRAKILEHSIETVTNQWIIEHRHQEIMYQGQKLSFQNYIAIKSLERLLSKLERRILFEKSNDKVGQNVTAKLGYTLEDVRSPQFRQEMYEILKNNMETLLSKVCSGSYTYNDEIKINVRNGKQIFFSGFDLEVVIQELSVRISKYDPNFIPMVQAAIKKEAGRWGVDSAKFCFDLKIREKLKMITEQRQEQPKKETLDSETLLQIIDPILLERNLKLPNGVEIPAKKYIQEIVYPQLPKDGIIILNNGKFLTIKQFIEKGVMIECQEKYNGDFPRYMIEKTKNNLGVVTISSGDKSYDLKPQEITKHINPFLLKKRVKLSNGSEISAKQYIEEVYAPHIPTNGKVTLSNGVVISVKQYIEEVLLSEGQEKYNGDIGQILYHTTRNNTGVVNINPNKIQEVLITMRNQVKSMEEKRFNGHKK